MKSCLSLFVTCIAVCLTSDVVGGSVQGRFLQIDVLMQPSPSSQLRAREWAAVFQKVGHNATFRQGRAGERTTVEDMKISGQTGVRLVGLLERDGSISFSGRKFRGSQDKDLKVWFDRLLQYGAKGPPDEHPTWGLEEADYKKVLQALGKPVDKADPINMSTPLNAIAALNVQSEFTVKFTPAAAVLSSKQPSRIGDTIPNVRQFSKGTALAIALAQFGLGFRPLANPEGGFFLQVDVGNEDSNLYPVGWKNSAPVTTLVPGIARSITVELDNEPLHGLMKVIAQRLELPLVYAGHDLVTDGKDLSTIKYSRKRDKLPPARLMRIIGSTHKIGMSIRTDEAGKLFLWVTTDANARSFDQRFR